MVAMDAGPGSAIMYADDADQAVRRDPASTRLEVTRVFEVDPASFGTLEQLQLIFQSSVLERLRTTPSRTTRRICRCWRSRFLGTTFRRADSRCRRILVDPASAAEQLQTIGAAAREEPSSSPISITIIGSRPGRTAEMGEDFARRCIDAGARTFVSHGAPVLQPIEIHEGAPLFYGLGNFFFHLEEGKSEWSPPEVWKSVVATCVFKAPGQLQSIDLSPNVLGGEAGLGDDNFHERRLPIAATGAVGHAIIEDLEDGDRPLRPRIERDGTRQGAYGRRCELRRPARSVAGRPSFAVEQPLNRRGWERRYWLGARTFAPSSAAACQGQRGS